MAGRHRIHIASIRKTPRRRARQIRSVAWPASSASGFSQSTALPASSISDAAL
jgi:hypothetical protein